MRRPAAALALALVSCADAPTHRSAADGALDPEAQRVLERETQRIDREAARIDSLFQPLPLLRPADEAALTRYGNAQQLARARALGTERLLPAERIAQLEQSGALVQLHDSEHWVVRDMDHSQPLVVPAMRDLLTQIGTRFHQRLREIGAPAFRVEISSALRTAADQAALRRVNPNAASGESTHEYGTTVDLLYSAFAAPAQAVVQIDTQQAPWLSTHLTDYARVAAERVAARRAHELKAILGHVLIELQNEGKVMVTLEKLQPVFHMTVGDRR